MSETPKELNQPEALLSQNTALLFVSEAQRLTAGVGPILDGLPGDGVTPSGHVEVLFTGDFSDILITRDIGQDIESTTIRFNGVVFSGERFEVVDGEEVVVDVVVGHEDPISSYHRSALLFDSGREVRDSEQVLELRVMDAQDGDPELRAALREFDRLQGLRGTEGVNIPARLDDILASLRDLDLADRVVQWGREITDPSQVIN